MCLGLGHTIFFNICVSRTDVFNILIRDSTGFTAIIFMYGMDHFMYEDFVYLYYDVDGSLL